MNSTGCFTVPSIRTVTGKRVDLIDPSPDSIDLEDIAVGLSNQCRFGGQTYRHYSVAEHCVACYDNAVRVGEPLDVQLAVLLHDAAEAYLGDVIRPLKLAIGEQYLILEEMMQDAIDQAFFIDTFEHHDVIKMHDNAICEAEMKEICPEDYKEVRGQFDALKLGHRRAFHYVPQFLSAEESRKLYQRTVAKVWNLYAFEHRNNGFTVNDLLGGTDG